MAVELCPSSRLKELLGDCLLYGSATVELDDSTFNGSLIALYFVPLSIDPVKTDDRDLRDLYKTVNENEKTLSVVQICYPDTADDRKCFDELTNNVPWHSVLYEHVEKRVNTIKTKYKTFYKNVRQNLKSKHISKIITEQTLDS